jgi:hypothetical protein
VNSLTWPCTKQTNWLRIFCEDDCARFKPRWISRPEVKSSISVCL